ncbi:transposase [Citrobacter sp. wls826]|uniref:transposase n=1 Tax=Citrobacter sp. wls826 TaxID=2576415 RepID=UPI0010C9EA58|nr:transposase [Citrobacter sp. wls826]TKV30133.1 transposase [Citrobacter sp. TBCS-11]
MERRNLSGEFKLESSQLAFDQKYTVAAVVSDMEVGLSSHDAMGKTVAVWTLE